MHEPKFSGQTLRLFAQLAMFCGLLSGCFDPGVEGEQSDEEMGLIERDGGGLDASPDQAARAEGMDASIGEDTEQRDLRDREDLEQLEDLTGGDQARAPDLALDLGLDLKSGDDGTGEMPYPGLSDEALKKALRDAREHDTLDYTAARMQLFEHVDQDGGEVECVYTGERVATLTIPPHTLMNTEHTWPQSQGADRLPARSDLHHLFATLSTANTKRSNHPFCEVTTSTWSQGGSRLGERSSDGATCFEPREVHKGNVARAMFYFATIYRHAIDAEQEATLRAWHESDAVDLAERERHERVARAQRSRNPFVDSPELVARIADF